MDWFRRSTWTSAERDEFEARFKRARAAGRAQYLRIQAVHLIQTGRDDLLPPAIELLRRVIAEDPCGIEVAPAQHFRAQCHERLGDVVRAAEAYRAALAAERRRPNVRTDAALDFALFVAERNLETLASEAAEVLDADSAHERRFPVQRFKYHAARALLADGRDRTAAAEEARRALQEAGVTRSGLRYHPDVGLVSDKYLALRRRLEALAVG